MPTSFGFTGQRQDAATGLGYLHARYLDPVLGQFTTADKLLECAGFDILGLSRYAYMEGNPIGRTDPTGHYADSGSSCDPDCGNVPGVMTNEVQASVGNYYSYTPTAFPYGSADPCGGWCAPAPNHLSINFNAPMPAPVPVPGPGPEPAVKPGIIAGANAAAAYLKGSGNGVSVALAWAWQNPSLDPTNVG
jgi:RHS repeat-associated protein